MSTSVQTISVHKIIRTKIVHPFWPTLYVHFHTWLLWYIPFWYIWFRYMTSWPLRYSLGIANKLTVSEFLPVLTKVYSLRWHISHSTNKKKATNHMTPRIWLRASIEQYKEEHHYYIVLMQYADSACNMGLAVSHARRCMLIDADCLPGEDTWHVVSLVCREPLLLQLLYVQSKGVKTVVYQNRLPTFENWLPLPLPLWHHSVTFSRPTAGNWHTHRHC